MTTYKPVGVDGSSHFPPRVEAHIEALIAADIAAKASTAALTTETSRATAAEAAAQAYAIQRGNHTGSQLSTTISDFVTAVEAVAGRVMVVDNGDGTVTVTTTGGGFVLTDNGDGTATLTLDGTTVIIGAGEQARATAAETALQNLTNSTFVAGLNSAFAGRQRDDLAHHNEWVGGGSGQSIPNQGTFYGNTLFGGGGYNGASPNVITGQASLRDLWGGYDNHLGASLAAGILHGMHGTIDDLSTHAIIVGGSSQTITDSDYSSTLGGSGNNIGSTGKQANYAGAYGGQTNTVEQYWGFIGGGHNNHLGYNAAGAGASGILAGESIAVFGKYAAAWGSTNLAGTSGSPTYGDYTTVGGLNNQLGQTANASYSTAFGRDHGIDVQYGAALGRGARPANQGAVAHAMGSAVTAGDRQTSENVVRREISAIIATGLYIDATGSLVMPDNTSWGFLFDVTARRASDGKTAHWLVKGTVKRGSGAASTALVGNPTVETLANEVPAWVCDVVADTTNGSPLVRIKPDTTDIISAAARFETVQVTA